MKTILRLLALVAALSVGWAVNAQSSLEDYVFSTGIDSTKWAYVPTNAQNLMDIENTQDSVSHDNRTSNLVGIGFTFPYGDSTYTTLAVNADGTLRLGNRAGTLGYSIPFSSSNANINNPKINFFGCDGWCIFEDVTHYIRVVNVGYNQTQSKCVVEFCLGTYVNSTRNQQYKWQVHLYPSGTIEVVFPPSVPATAPDITHQMGLCMDVTDGWVIDTNNNATHFSDGSSTSWPNGRWPEANRYYAFHPCKTIPNSYDYQITPATSWRNFSSSTTNACNYQEIFKVPVTAGYTYFFTTGCEGNATADFDTYLYLYDNSGAQIVSNDDGCGSSYSIIKYTSTESDTVYLAVRGYNSYHGTYTLAYRRYPYFTMTEPTNSWQTRSSNISSSNDKRIFRVYLNDLHKYTFKTGCGDGATANFDTKLELYDNTGTRITYNDNDCENNRSKIEYHPSSSGYYNLIVSGATNSDIGSFTLAYKRECLTPPDYNYYISPSSTTWSTYSSTLETIDGCSLTNRIYYFYARNGSTYTFKTGCGDGATADFDTYLELYDANGNQVSYNDDGCEYNRSYLDYTATQTGSMYLLIRGFNTEITGSYTLASKVCKGIPDYDYSITPSDSWSTTSRSTANTCNHQQICSAYLYAGSTYTFKTGCGDGATADFDTYLQLVDSNLNLLAFNDNTSDCDTNTLTSKIEYTATQTGRVFLLVQGNDGQSGDYTLAYRKCTSIPDYDYSISPSNSWYTTTSRSTANACNRKHIYRIHCYPDRLYTFTTGCGGEATADFDTYLELYEANGALLSTGDDECANHLSKLDFQTETSGYFYLVVTGYNFPPNDIDTGNYRLAYKYCTSYYVSANTSPMVGGIVYGTGPSCANETCTLEAIPDVGYTFVNWTEGSTVVSTDPVYTFTATSNRTLTANFTFNTANCSIAINQNYFNNFDNYTTSTTPKTGIQPDCWTLVHQYVSMTDAYKPMIYYSTDNAFTGNYSLILNKRCLYAMPYVENPRRCYLEFRLKQPQEKYLLQIGVMTDLNDESTFVPYWTLSNKNYNISTDDFGYFRMRFHKYNVKGHYIAFRNILADGYTGDYSVNYLDNIYLYDVGCIDIDSIYLPYNDNFDQYTTSTTAKTGEEPFCWQLAGSDVTMTDEYKPMIYYSPTNAHSGNYSLILNKRGIYAMPHYSQDVRNLQLDFYLKQTQAKYQLEVGVIHNGSFYVASTINNPTTDYEHVTVNFSSLFDNYTNGFIAFRNILAPGQNGDYSINYIDDLVLDLRPVVTCTGINVADLPYTDNFDTYTSSTTAKTGVEPDCWALAHQYVTMTDEYKPMIYYSSANAHSGNYSLLLNKRGIYTMPEFNGDVNTLQMSFYLKQTQAKYQLQVGVMSDLSNASSFVPVATFNNSSTTASVLCNVDFSSYTGSGHYIAFRNILASGQTGDYSCNYIDDITLELRPVATCTPIQVADLPYSDNFDSYTTSHTAKTMVEPDCWTLAHQDVAMTDEYKPMVYYNASNAHSGSYSLLLNKRCIYAMPEFNGNVNTLHLKIGRAHV